MNQTTLAAQQHYVTFYSPGTIVPEESTFPVDAWDVEAAKEQARTISERHGAKPYCFIFTTRGRSARELDSRETERSPRYFLGGRVMTLNEVKAQMPDNHVLVFNMEANKIKRVLVNDNSWRVTVALNDDDVVLDWKSTEPTAKP